MPYPWYQNNLYPQYSPAQQSIYNYAGNNSLIWVRNRSEADSYPTAPNTAIAMWDITAPVVYLKQADASGRPTLKVFDLVERQDQKDPGGNATEDYATKSDVFKLGEVVSSLKSEMDRISDDLYGIAGKRKSGKKLKEDDTEEE